MFDFAFSELALIGAVALVVIGPERLPRVARTAGVVVGRLQRYAATVKADIAREVELSELRRMQGEIRSAAQTFETSMRESLASAETQFQHAQQTVMGGPQPSPASLAAASLGTEAQSAGSAPSGAGLPDPHTEAADAAAAAIGAPSPRVDALAPAHGVDAATPPGATTPLTATTPAVGAYAEDPFHFPAPAAAAGAPRPASRQAAQSSLFDAAEAPPGTGLADAAHPARQDAGDPAPTPPA